MTALMDAKTAGHAIATSCDGLSCESKGSEVERLPGLMQYMPLRCTKFLHCPEKRPFEISGERRIHVCSDQRAEEAPVGIGR